VKYKVRLVSFLLPWQIHEHLQCTLHAKNLIYSYIFLPAIGLTPGGSRTVHIYAQTVHRTTQSTQTIHTATHLTNWGECGPCPVLASYTLAFDLQLRKKHGKTSVRVVEECQLARWKRNVQNRAYITIRIHKRNDKNTWLTELNKSMQTSTTHTMIKKNQKNMKE
jgi:hypothetical protein